MAHYQTTIDSPLAPAEAFARLADVTRFAEWDPGVKAARQVEGDGPGLGAGYVLTVKGVAGTDTDLRYDVIDYVEPTTLHLLAESSLLRSDDLITVEPSGDGSRVTYRAELDLTGPGGLLKVADPVLGLAFDKIGDRAAKGLTTFLDAD